MGILKENEKERFYKFVSENARSVEEIAATLDISLSSCYNKMRVLEAQGMIFKIGKRYKAA